MNYFEGFSRVVTWYMGSGISHSFVIGELDFRFGIRITNGIAITKPNYCCKWRSNVLFAMRDQNQKLDYFQIGDPGQRDEHD